MLTHTFSHISGIGIQTEKTIWAAGIRDWDAFMSHPSPPLSRPKRQEARAHLELSSQALAAHDPFFFAATLPVARHWRLFPHFRATTAFLDIETTADAGEITVITLYDGRDIRSYVNGRNLSEFESDIGRYQVIVTFNGKQFDAPVIERFLRLRLPQVHLDLRHILRAMGIRGGLKSCERRFGIERGALAGVDGLAAIRLWHEYETRGNEQALETLLAYNVLDVINLETLMVAAYNLLAGQTPFAAETELPVPELPPNPHAADLAVIAWLWGDSRGGLASF